MVTEDKALAFFIEQFKESGSLIRLMATLRATYLGFYFTFLAAGIGAAFAVTGLPDNPDLGIGGGVKFFILNSVSLFISWIGMFVFVSIKKIGYAHDLHSRFIVWTREQYMSRDQLEEMFGRFGYSSSPVNRRIFSVQNTAEWLVAMTIFLICLAESYLSLAAAYLRHWSWCQGIAFVLLGSITIISLVVAFNQDP